MLIMCLEVVWSVDGSMCLKRINWSFFSGTGRPVLRPGRPDSHLLANPWACIFDLGVFHQRGRPVSGTDRPVYRRSESLLCWLNLSRWITYFTPYFGIFAHPNPKSELLSLSTLLLLPQTLSTQTLDFSLSLSHLNLSIWTLSSLAQEGESEEEEQELQDLLELKLDSSILETRALCVLHRLVFSSQILVRQGLYSIPLEIPCFIPCL